MELGRGHVGKRVEKGNGRGSDLSSLRIRKKCNLKANTNLPMSTIVLRQWRRVGLGRGARGARLGFFTVYSHWVERKALLCSVQQSYLLLWCR